MKTLLLILLTTFYPQQAAWLEKAESLRPELKHTLCTPQRMVTPLADATAFQGWRYDEDTLTTAEALKTVLKPGMSFTFDFGRHMVGYLTIRPEILTRCQDAPLRLRLFVGELPAEMNTPLEPWGAWLSRGWMQDDIVTLYDLTQPYVSTRRQAGRYLRVEVLGASKDFDCVLGDITFDAVSSAGEAISPKGEQINDPTIQRIYEVGLETLRECMQTVYEDGPKRDRRLWAGDLYLQSLANRYSFRNFDLTKRCLYLFAALAAEDGTLISNIFEYPTPHPQVGSYMITYSLLWNSTLLEYLIDTDDRETAEELWPVAKRQMEDALTYVGKDYLFDINKRDVWIFFDWRDGLDVTTPMQCATVFALDQTYELAKRIGRESEVKQYPTIAAKMRKAAIKHDYDASRGVMMSGPERQVSVLSQTWAIKSGVLSGSKAQRALRAVLSSDQAVRPGTPYATHYVVEALLMAGMPQEAKAYLVDYWGGMVRRGADTFWEAYDPMNDYLSPYDFFPVNSACHAWSCTPVYFIGRYPDVFRQ